MVKVLSEHNLLSIVDCLAPKDPVFAGQQHRCAA